MHMKSVLGRYAISELLLQWRCLAGLLEMIMNKSAYEQNLFASCCGYIKSMVAICISHFPMNILQLCESYPFDVQQSASFMDCVLNAQIREE